MSTIFENLPRLVIKPNRVEWRGWLCTADPKSRVTADQMKAIKRHGKYGGELLQVYVGK